GWGGGPQRRTRKGVPGDVFHRRRWQHRMEGIDRDISWERSWLEAIRADRTSYHSLSSSAERTHGTQANVDLQSSGTHLDLVGGGLCRIPSLECSTQSICARRLSISDRTRCLRF